MQRRASSSDEPRTTHLVLTPYFCSPSIKLRQPQSAALPGHRDPGRRDSCRGGDWDKPGPQRGITSPFQQAGILGLLGKLEHTSMAESTKCSNPLPSSTLINKKNLAWISMYPFPSRLMCAGINRAQPRTTVRYPSRPSWETLPISFDLRKSKAHSRCWPPRKHVLRFLPAPTRSISSWDLAPTAD